MRAIERAVEKAGTQQKLADILGVAQSQISHWVSGDPVHHRHYEKIESATGVTAHELLADELKKTKQADRLRRRTSAA